MSTATGLTVRRQWINERRTAATEAYDAEAATYDVNPYPNDTQHAWVNRLLASIPAGSTVLDAPCGTGRYFPSIAAGGHHVVGIDQSAGMLAEAASRGLAAELHHLGLQELPFGNRFDAAITVDAMEHVAPEDWPLVLANLHRAVRTDGLIYVTVEEDPEADFTSIHEALLARGLPAVLGEVIDGDVAGYHYYPTGQQVGDWIAAEGLAVIDETYHQDDGWGYRHLLLRS
jgi:cyclopropane fatty-acyl-phospholipid synthase-like methyltransferase